MELIIFDINKQYNLPPLITALGLFDGLHIAHRRLLEKTVELAKCEGAASAVITFDPHPDYILGKRKPDGYLTPLKQKEKALSALGIQYLIIIPFTKEVSQLSYEKFEKFVLAKFNIIRIVIGFDYRYGYKGAGSDLTLARKYPVHVIEEVTFKNEKIGSAGIRKMLENGDIQGVRNVLGNYYQIEGTVEFGEQIGRTMGIRTANINLADDYQQLKTGVYAVLVTIEGKRYIGVANYGVRPTFGTGFAPRLEVHIIGFVDTIYGANIVVEFIDYIREERKFPNREALIIQINNDIETVKQMEIIL